MQVLSNAETEEFLQRHTWATRAEELVAEPLSLEVTTDVGRRYAYANFLTAQLLTNPEAIACVDIDDWDVWPSSQNPDLFYAYRRSLGEHRLLHEAHFHVFTANEAIELRNILHIALISLYNVGAASSGTNLRVFASHDEYIQVSWPEDPDLRPNAEWFLKD